jgi:hypothetical protein
VTETPGTTRKINNLEDVHCVRDAGVWLIAVAAPGVSNLAIRFELRGASFVNEITRPTGDRM